MRTCHIEASWPGAANLSTMWGPCRVYSPSWERKYQNTVPTLTCSRNCAASAMIIGVSCCPWSSATIPFAAAATAGPKLWPWEVDHDAWELVVLLAWRLAAQALAPGPREPTELGWPRQRRERSLPAPPRLSPCRVA